MAARAIWKGVVRFEDVAVPVRLYSAVQDQGVRFRLLHAKDAVPVRQQMVNPATGESVPYEEMKRGYEVEPGVFVILEKDELEKLVPEPSRDIEVTRFVDPALINHQWYEHPYWLGPDDGGATAYAALESALVKKKLEGVARWVMRKKQYVGALWTHAGRLMLISLRNVDEIVQPADLPMPSGRDLDEKELRMAEQLISALEGEFDSSAYHDEFRERVLKLVATKARGGKVKKVKPKEPAPAKSLEQALRASLQTIGRGKASA